MKTYKHTGPARNQHCRWGSGEPTVRREGGRPPSSEGLGSSPPRLCSWPDLVASAGCYWVCCLHTGMFPSQRLLLEASKTAAKNWVWRVMMTRNEEKWLQVRGHLALSCPSRGSRGTQRSLSMDPETPSTTEAPQCSQPTQPGETNCHYVF